MNLIVIFLIGNVVLDIKELNKCKLELKYSKLMQISIAE